MSFEDWRDANPDTIAALYARECRRWQHDLAWDTRASWDLVEQGRALGHVPGWILRNTVGAVCGWTYYLLHDGELQIGGLTADRAVDLRRLLDRVLESPEASLASAVSCFVFPSPPALTSALSRRRFIVRRSLYLTREFAESSPRPATGRPGLVVRPFHQRDMLAAVRLVAGAYEGEPGAICFAPHSRLDEWVRYLSQLITTPACGRYLPAASLVAEDEETGRLSGLVLTTALDPRTAHIAQLVVGQHARRQGVGEALLINACDRARQLGHPGMTLMVDEGNRPAIALYERHGFAATSAFVFGRRGQVRRTQFVPQPHQIAV